MQELRAAIRGTMEVFDEAPRFARAWKVWRAQERMDLGLQGRVAIVAAASKGLGRAVAEELAREGAHVAMCSRDGKNIEQAAEEIQGLTKHKLFWRA